MIIHKDFKAEMESLGVVPTEPKQIANIDHSRPSPDNIDPTQSSKEVLIESMAVDPNRTQHALESEEEMRKPGLQIKEFRRLKQGKFCREDVLHLRGMTVENAIRELQRFLDKSTRSGFQCVKIIHGKGLNSPDGISQIKLQCQNHFRRNKFVLGYCRATSNDGGRGATFVLLKKRNR